MNNSYELKVVAYFKKNNASKTFDELKKHFDIKNNKREREFQEALYEMGAEGKLVKMNNKFNLPQNLGLVKGKVLNGAKGYLFVEDLETGEEYFIPPGNNGGAFESDIVWVQLKRGDNPESGHKKSGKITSIIQRGKEHIVGTYITEGNVAYVEINNRGDKKRISVPNSKLAVEGHEVVAILEDDGSTPKWVVSKVLGHKDEPTTEIISLLYKHGIKSEFDDLAIEEAEELETTIPEMEYYTRKDLRNETIITIDGIDAKDLDDAISLKALENGNYLLGVHIADVSFYVRADSSLDKEALERGTSVYLTNKVVPMLPQKLSNGICSLLPNVDRLTITCEMEIDKNDLSVVGYSIYDSIINTSARLNYDQVNEFYMSKKEAPENEDEINNMLLQMLDLSKKLKSKRMQRGSIDFDVREARVKVDEQNKPIDILVRDRGDSEKLIEEFMLIANETVAKHFSMVKLPFIYRIHDEPNSEKVEQVSNLVLKLGFPNLVIRESGNPIDIQKMLDGVRGSSMEKTIHTLSVRMMSKAIYSDINNGHFGLAKEFYTHFTSPIRRYPDLIVHRLIREFVLEHNVSKKSRDYWSRVLPDITRSNTQSEIRAAEAEREILEIKKVEYMTQFIGETFTGAISSLTEFGFFVELDNTVQGLVAIESLPEKYSFDEENYVITSQSGDNFLIGDLVEVRLVSANKEKQKIEFSLVKKI